MKNRYLCCGLSLLTLVLVSCGGDTDTSSVQSPDVGTKLNNTQKHDQASMSVSNLESVLVMGLAPYRQSLKMFLNPETGHADIQLSQLIRSKTQQKSTHQTLANPATAAAPTTALPTTFDWRSDSKAIGCNINSVFNQGQCGSCWANSAAYTMGNAYCIQKGSNPGALSAQYIMDSAIGYSMGSYPAPTGFGCSGGSPVAALSIAQTNGIPLNTCRVSLFNNSAAGSLTCGSGDSCTRCTCSNGQAVDLSNPTTGFLATYQDGSTAIQAINALPIVFSFVPQLNMAATVQTSMGNTTLVNFTSSNTDIQPLLLAEYSGYLTLSMNNPVDATGVCATVASTTSLKPCTFTTTCDDGTPISSQNTLKVSNIYQIDSTTLSKISGFQNAKTLPTDTTDSFYASAINQIKTMVQTYGPVTVGFNVPISFMLYQEGVYRYTGWIPYSNQQPGQPVPCTASSASSACAVNVSASSNLYQLYSELSQILVGQILATNCVDPTTWQPVSGSASGVCALQDAMVGGHAVSIVGWGTDATSNQNYWIIANNWGSDWGENGFFNMAMNGMTGAQLIFYYDIAAAQF